MPERRTIRQLREERGWSQHQLAVRLGVTVPTIYNWERGRFEPTASKFRALAETFEVPMEDIEVGIDRGTDMGKAAA